MPDSDERPGSGIEIVLADDHTMVRRGLRMVLDSEPGLTVVAEAGDVDSALRATRELRPHVVVLDLNMPGEPTLPAIPRFLQVAPGAAIVVLTMESDPVFARRALAAGASGYVLKEGAEDELVGAIRAVAGGGTYLNPGLGGRLAAGATAELGVGSEFAGHRIEGIAGRGGMGVVYRATDLTLDRRVALKLIAPSVAGDDEFRARFERECRVAASLEHPHVVPIYHAGQEGERLYVTMRFIEGTDLRALLAEQGRLDMEHAVAIITQVAGALDEAHRHGLVHRDVKPGNILIERDGGGRVFLTDFGVTKQRTAGDELTRTGMAVLSARCLILEQLLGPPTSCRPSRLATPTSTVAPTSTRSAACSSAPSPARWSSTATATSTSCGRTSTSRRARCSACVPSSRPGSATRSPAPSPRNPTRVRRRQAGSPRKPTRRSAADYG